MNRSSLDLTAVRNLRFAQELYERRRRLGEWLAEVGEWVATGRLGLGEATCDPRLLVVIGVDDQGPFALWDGEGRAADLDAAAAVLTGIAEGVKAGGTDMVQLVAGARATWADADAARRADAEARRTWLAGHPWCCEYCEGRFSTLAGAESHEQGCAANPRARPHRRRRRRLS